MTIRLLRSEPFAYDISEEKGGALIIVPIGPVEPSIIVPIGPVRHLFLKDHTI